MFIACPPARPSPRRDLQLVRAVRRRFTGPAEFLDDPANRARVDEYLADLTRPYSGAGPGGLFAESPSPVPGHSYGEMAAKLIGSAVPADELVDLLILAFSIHDVRPGRQTAAYLSHLTPGAPMAFAICDQGSAAAFSGLRIARDYASSAGVGRVLLVVVEQSALPYRSPAATPARHQGVAMLFADRPVPQAQVTAVRQHPDVPADRVARIAAADLGELTADHPEAGLVLTDALAAAWTAPAAKRLRVIPPGQPSTGLWWGLLAELGGGGHPDLLVAADYDPELRYLCLTAFEPRPRRG